jgi:hypothetical protein
MNSTLRMALAIAALSCYGPSTFTRAFGQAPAGSRFADFNTIVQGAKEHDGLFKLYQKDGHVYLEILPHQFDKPILCPIAVARGAGLGGYTLNEDEQWVLLFKRVDDKVQLIRRNVHFKAKPGTPLARAVETTYTDSVLLAPRIVAIDTLKTQGILIDLNDVFMTDFAQLGGGFDTGRSSWHKVKVFPRNLELEVEATYAGGWDRSVFGEDDTTIDRRGNTLILHYGLAELPDSGYQPRLADDRIGYFVSAVKDFSTESKDTSFVRYINRWRLERAEPVDPKNPNALSVPKRSIKFYIEKTVPYEYRPAIQAGILEWNKPFERIGFRNAIEVVQQRDDEDFDPEDMNYNTFRWITTDVDFAFGPSRCNPLTGEILDADILFDASVIRHWKQQAPVYSGHGIALEPVSPVQVLDLGWGLDHPLLRRSLTGGWHQVPLRDREDRTAARLRAIQQGVCRCGNHLRSELNLAALALMERGLVKPGERVPDDLINQMIKETVMHEVGHTLGLRHNFKGSTMLPNEQLHDTRITRERGLVGSVMDYNAINLAPRGVTQGDYFTTTLGPYDYWAIEYGYKPLGNSTEGDVPELQKIARRSAEPGHAYGTDEDIFLTADPEINTWDIGADTMRFAQDRMLLAEELLNGLSTRVVDKGEGYQRTRVAFNTLLHEFGDGTYFISRYVGGEHAYRDHRDDPQGHEPLMPVTAAKQRAALKFLQEHVLTEKPFQFSPELLRRLAVERWSHWGVQPIAADFPLHERILGIQRLALNQLLSPAVLRRIQNNALKCDRGEPLTLAEVFRGVTDGVWSDVSLPSFKSAKPAVPSSIIRRNLQREYVKKLSSLVLGQRSGGDPFLMYYFGDTGGTPPEDARSLARMYLRQISKRLQAVLAESKITVDETTRAHLEECQERITKVLSAAMQVND